MSIVFSCRANDVHARRVGVPWKIHVSDRGNNIAVAREKACIFCWKLVIYKTKRQAESKQKKNNSFVLKVNKMVLWLKGAIIYIFFKVGLRETTNRLQKMEFGKSAMYRAYCAHHWITQMRETARLRKGTWERRTREMLGEILTSTNEGTASKCPCGISTKKPPFKFHLEFFENFG